jgi:NAD+ kinase
MKNVAVFGGAFDPPGVHHLVAAIAMLRSGMDEVIIFPSGSGRSDKVPQAPDHLRGVMCLETFEGIPNISVDLSDIQEGVFTPTWQYEQRFSHMGDVWIAVGADLCSGGCISASQIQSSWQLGGELWNRGKFLVLRRIGYELMDADLPPHSRLIPTHGSGASSVIRRKIAMSNQITGVAPMVEAIIRSCELYGYKK